MNADQILTSKDVAPTRGVLERELGDRFAVYERMTERLGSAEFGVRHEWRYYRDGGWLCKMTRRAKTVFWMSAWRTCLKAAFYLPLDCVDEVRALPIDASLKTAFEGAKAIGKVRPLVIEVRGEEQLGDLFMVAAYKISRR